MAKFGYDDARLAVQAQHLVVAQGGLNLVAYGALAFVSAVYWDDAKVTAKDVRENMLADMATVGYKRGAQYDYASLAWTVAAKLVKAYGQGHGKEVNPFWTAIHDADTIEAAAVHIVNDYFKATLKATDVRTLRAALDSAKAPKEKKAKPALEAITAACDKAIKDGASVDAVSEAIVTVAAERLGETYRREMVATMCKALTDESLMEAIADMTAAFEARVNLAAHVAAQEAAKAEITALAA